MKTSAGIINNPISCGCRGRGRFDVFRGTMVWTVDRGGFFQEVPVHLNSVIADAGSFLVLQTDCSAGEVGITRRWFIFGKGNKVANPGITGSGKDDFVDDEGSITRVIRRMKMGDKTGADLLWERFYARLKYLVKSRMHSRMRTLSDEEDVALESIAELFRGLMDGKYPSLDSREDFWRLLVTVATRNVIDDINRENRQKRGSGRTYHESALADPLGNQAAFFDQLPSNVKAPDVQLMITERCTELLESLVDEELLAIAVMKTSGLSNNEVARSLGISLRSVERRLSDIRDCWAPKKS